VQRLTALSVLSQHYEAVLKPDAERGTTTIEAEAFAAASKSIAAESPARQGGGYHSSLPGRLWSPTISCFKYFRCLDVHF
jgi:hypothetical protein